MAPAVHVLASDHWRVGVLPEVGASLAFGQGIGPHGPVDVLRPTPAAALGRVSRTASFPLVPWSNRIPEGRLTVGGRTWQLRRNSEDGTAEHGTVTEYPWQVLEATDERLDAQLTSRDVLGVNFPWHFVAEIGYRLEGPDLVVRTALRNDDAEPFPAGFGHHPYFVRRLRPGAAPATLALDATHAYPLRGCVATGPAQPVAGRTDLRTPSPVGTHALDDCFTGFGPGPRRARIDHGELELRIDADPEYSHLVVYVPRGREYLAVEPVTHANGAHALAERGVPGHGLRTLAPGETWSAQWRVGLTWA